MSRRKKTASGTGGTVSTGVTVTDAFSNPIYRLGFGTQAPLEATEYPLTRLTENYALLNSMYRSGGILQSVVEIVPNDMVREWYTLQGDISPDDLDALEKVQRKIKLRDQILEGLKWGRLYGGAAGIILIRGQENKLDKPLNINSIYPGSFKGLLILDRWSGVFPDAELVTDINSPDFGLPKYYTINSGDGTMAARVHHSRIIRFVGRDLPFLEKIAEQYWGESEIEPIIDDIKLYDSIMQNMGNLTFRANLDTMEVQNLDQLFAITSSEQQRRFWSMMQAQSVVESNFGMRLVNKGDQISNRQYTFAGFNYVTEAAQLNLCAKTHIPMTKLFGRSPAGMNSTGESDLQNYYDIVDGFRESKLRPVLEKLLPVLCMSTWGKVPEDLNIQFPPLWTPTATEIANIAKTKTDTIIAAFQAGTITLGAAQKELKRLTEETGLFDSITNEEIEKNDGKSYRDVTELQDPTAGITPGADEDSPFNTADAVAMDGVGYNPYRDPATGRFSNGPHLHREEQKRKYPPNTDAKTIVNFNDINSNDYAKAFMHLEESGKVRRRLLDYARKMLNHRSGSNCEDMIFINAETGKYASNEHHDVPYEVDATPRMIALAEDAGPNKIIVMHNHSDSDTPSRKDIKTAFERKYKYGLIGCHNGKIFKYSVGQNLNLDEADFQLDFINKLIYDKNGLDINLYNSSIKALHDAGVDFEIIR